MSVICIQLVPMVYGATWQAGAGKLMGSLNVLTAYPLAALAALVTLHWRVTCTAYFVTSSKVPGRRCLPNESNRVW